MCDRKILEQSFWSMLVGEKEVQRMKILGRITGLGLDFWKLHTTAMNVLEFVIISEAEGNFIASLPILIGGLNWVLRW